MNMLGEISTIQSDTIVMFKILNMPVNSQIKKSLLDKLLTINTTS